ncbi:hypothetical protein ES707_11664 [subsurface metagenome]
MPEDIFNRPGYVYKGQDWQGVGIWELDPDLPVTHTEIINWSDPVTDPVHGTGGADASLALYLGQSEAQEEQYEIDSKNLKDSFEEYEKILGGELSEQGNVQGGGYGLGLKTNKTDPGASFPFFLVLVAGGLWWYFK